MLGAFRVCRIAFDDEIALLANVSNQPFYLSRVIVSFNQSQIENSRSGRWYNVARECADVAARKAVNVERRNVDQLHQRLAAALGPAQSQLLLQLFIILRRLRNRAALALAQRLGI